MSWRDNLISKPVLPQESSQREITGVRQRGGAHVSDFPTVQAVTGHVYLLITLLICLLSAESLC